MAVQPFSFRRVAVPVFAPSLLFGLGEGAILPAVPLAVRDLGGSVSMAALMVTLLGIGALASNLPASLITVRFGERRAIVGASIWCALGMLLCLAAPGIASFAAGILMVGMASAVFGLARLSYLAEAVPASLRARAMSTLGGVLRIGLFAGPFAAAAVMHWAGLAGAEWLWAVRMSAKPTRSGSGAVASVRSARHATPWVETESRSDFDRACTT